MKKIFSIHFRILMLLVLCLCLNKILYAQPAPVAFACGNGSSNFCNSIANWTLTTNTNPFEDGYPFASNINNWTSSHGSPQINKAGQSLGPTVNHASMWSRAAFDVNNNVISTGEGIATGIPATAAGGNYELSFLMRYSSYGSDFTPDLDEYYVVLMTCAAFNSIRNSNPMVFTLPNIPATGTQVIHTGINSTNLTWQTVTKSFTANAAYTVLWIFPKNISPRTGQATEAFLHIGLPSIKNKAFCTAANPVPAITSNSYFQYGACTPTTPGISFITPNTTTNSTCFFWECSATANLISNIGNTNDQWYVNDVLITSNGTSSVTGTVDISQPGILKLSPHTARSLYKIQLKNTTYGNNSLTPATYVAFSIFYASSDFNFRYIPGSTVNMSTPLDWLAGPNATYTWSVPGFSIADASTLTPQAQVTFPSNAPLSGITGTLTVANSSCNGVYNVTFTNGLRIATPGWQEPEIFNTIKLYPNPSVNQTTITSPEEKILSVEITSLTGFQRKNIVLKDNKKITVIDVSDLKTGVYNCTVITEKGRYQEKLIIKK